MDRIKHYFLIIIFIFVAAYSYSERRELIPFTIDWLRMELVISGISSVIPKESGNTIEWQLDAAGEAEQNLFKIFIGSMNYLKINSYNTARDILTTDVHKNEYLYNFCDRVKKCTIQYNDQNVYITKVFPFFGDTGFMSILLRAGDDTGNFPKYNEYVYTVPFTGLVVDARGLGRIPAVAPRFFDEDHNLVYSLDLMYKEGFKKWGVVQYTDDPYYRGFEERVGQNPCKIVAVPNDRLIETDIEILNKDAKVLLQHEETKKNLMDGKVILIIDTLQGN